MQAALQNRTVKHVNCAAPLFSLLLQTQESSMLSAFNSINVIDTRDVVLIMRTFLKGTATNPLRVLVNPVL